MGIIDTHSDYSLYDIINGDLGFADLGNGYPEPEGTVSIGGLHIFPANDSGNYSMQLDGHVGLVDTVDADDYGDVLELVDDILTHLSEINHRAGDDEALVQYAGKVMTSNETRAEEQPEIYEYVPEDV